MPTPNQVRKKPNAGLGPAKDWVADMPWLHIVNLGNTLPVFKDLPDSMFRSEGIWRQWYDQEAPEASKIPVRDLSASAHAQSAHMRPAHSTHPHARQSQARHAHTPAPMRQHAARVACTGIPCKEPCCSSAVSSTSGH